MKKSELRQIIKEEISNVLNQKCQVIFWDINYDKYPVKQLFNSEKEAEEWADNKEWEEEYYAYDDEKGGDYLEYRLKWFNPEDKENYYGYEVKPVENISESQKTQIKQEMSSLLEEAKKRTEETKQLMRKKGYNV